MNFLGLYYYNGYAVDYLQKRHKRVDALNDDEYDEFLLLLSDAVGLSHPDATLMYATSCYIRDNTKESTVPFSCVDLDYEDNFLFGMSLMKIPLFKERTLCLLKHVKLFKHKIPPLKASLNSF